MDPSQPQNPPDRSGRQPLGPYLLAGLIGALVAILAMTLLTADPRLALAQTGPVSADGILAIQARLSSDSYGLYLIDVKNQTVMLYSYGGPWARGLRLLAARTFRYDRQLVDFNTAKPSPDDVRRLLQPGTEKTSPPPGPTPGSDSATDKPGPSEP